MRFPHAFTRYAGAPPAGGVAFGTSIDAAPAYNDPKRTPQDNYFAVKATTAAGYYLAGFRLVYSGPTASMTVKLFVFEQRSQSWVQLGADVVCDRGKIASVNEPIPTELGGIEVLVIPTVTGGEVAGAHHFAFSPQHSS